MNLVWTAASNCQGNTLLTLLALADWSDDSGKSWPALLTLAKKSRQSERNCRTTLRNLQKMELVEITERPGTSPTYHINIALLSGGKLCPPAKSGRGGERISKTTEISAPNTSINHQVDQPSPSGGEGEQKDPRFNQLKIYINTKWLEANPDIPSVAWTPRAFAEMAKMLDSVKPWTMVELIRCVNNYFNSDTNHGAMPEKFLRDLPNYLNRLNGFNRPKEQPKLVKEIISPAEKIRRQLAAE